MAGKNIKSMIRKYFCAETQRRWRNTVSFHFCIIIFLVFLVSCQSTSKVLDSSLRQGTQFLSLDSGAVIYVVADTKKARQIIDLLPVKELEDKQIKQMIDKTDYFIAAVFPPESGRRFQIASSGNYPSFGASLAFTFNSQWKKQKEKGINYWYSKASGVSLLVNSKQAFAVSGVNPVNPAAVPAETKIPEGFNQFTNQAPFSCWLNNPASFLNSILDSAGIPLQFSVKNFFANLFPAGGKHCQAVIRLQFENPTHARGMMALLNLAGNFSGGDHPLASIFFANPPVVDGSNLDIKTALLSEADLKGLFEYF
ncbi:MAG: hypothetical protein FWB89_01965 [Treponema sp.]|nr:hypothetical protein [Treponema sp.]